STFQAALHGWAVAQVKGPNRSDPKIEGLITDLHRHRTACAALAVDDQLVGRQPEIKPVPTVVDAQVQPGEFGGEARVYDQLVARHDQAEGDPLDQVHGASHRTQMNAFCGAALLNVLHVAL